MKGTLYYSGVYHEFTWEVPNFFGLPSEPSYFLQSEDFSFAGDFCCLRLYPHGTQRDDENIDILLLRLRLSSSAARKDIEYEIGYKSSTGEYCSLKRYDDRPVESVRGDLFSVQRSELEKNKDTHVPDGKWTVCCRILGGVSVLPLRGDDEQKGSPGVVKQQSDFKRLMLKGAESDACLVVCGKEFRAHKCVLRARSPVFEAMFHHETAEKESGRVVIDDLEPDRFEDFLEYMYTGRVDSFSVDNAFRLYAAADKYDVPTLRSECVEYMGRSLSVDSICDVLTVAHRNHEKHLMALAAEFFKANLTSIISTEKWQMFLSENGTGVNELLKAIVPGK